VTPLEEGSGGGGAPLSSTTLNQFAWEKNHFSIFFKNNNDHGLDVNVVIIIIM
jgi:hypothetical protein